MRVTILNWIIALAVTIGGSAYLIHRIDSNAAALVYSTCEQSRMSALDEGQEELCGELQDRLGIEYLCAERNSLPTNNCWTEIK